jgi:hypothetical protein
MHCPICPSIELAHAINILNYHRQLGLIAADLQLWLSYLDQVFLAVIDANLFQPHAIGYQQATNEIIDLRLLVHRDSCDSETH